jgi:competence protein ComEC
MQVTVLDINHESTTRKDTCITMRVMSIEDQNMTRLLSKNIYIYVPYYAKLWIKQGQVIFMRDVILQQPKSHSFQKYLIKEGIWALAHLKKLRYTTIRKPHPLVQYYGELKSNILTSMHEKISPKTYALYASIFCGKKLKTDESLQAKKLFQYWGISHYLARSGLHVMILIWLLFFMFSYIPCALAYKQLTIALILTLYYLATYSSIAFLRAFLMYILYMLCQILHLPVKTLHVFCTTTLLIVLYNPYQIFFLDFQLSFSITLLILWFLEQLQKRKTIAS